jgi:hypothetical protein
MIKKPVFENDLIAGMQHELRKLAAGGEFPDLVKAGERLHAALEILEDSGLQRHADNLLNVLEKIAAGHKGKLAKVPTREALKQHGITDQDLKNFGAGQAHAKAKMNSTLRRMGLSDAEITNFIGQHNFMSDEDIKRYLRLLNMINNPTEPAPGESQPEVPESISMESVPMTPDSGQLPSGEELTFKSIANAPRPDKVPDVHTKGLTPDKMVNNLKHHGTEFNMPDLGWSDNLDPEIAEAFDALNADELEMSDILDADITEDVLEVSEQNTLEDFEDEVSLPK